jgi:adenylate kinase
MPEVAAVFGPSGVGKSWLISRYVASTRIRHIQASQLLRGAKAASSGRSVTSEELRAGAVLDNQELLVAALARERAVSDSPIIFDGHCVVDNGAELTEIPVKVIDAFGLSGIVFVQGDSQLILTQRTNDNTKVRPVRSVEEIGHHQQQALSVCGEYARQLRVPLEIVDAGDEGLFSIALTSVFARRAIWR